MPRLTFIPVEVYELNEVREELAKRTGWPHKYSRERVYQLIRHYLPKVKKPTKFLTEYEVDLIASKIQTKKRKKTIDI